MCRQEVYYPNEPQQPNCVKLYIVHVMVKMLFGVNKYLQIFDAITEASHNL